MADLSRAPFAILLSLAFVAPFATADHAYGAVYVADDGWSGCRLTLESNYESGADAFQTWTFVVAVQNAAGSCWTTVDGDVCTVSGSLEDGFSGSCAAGSYLSVSGTGHYHPCCDYTALDIHDGIRVDFYSGLTFWWYSAEGGVVASG